MLHLRNTGIALAILLLMRCSFSLQTSTPSDVQQPSISGVPSATPPCISPAPLFSARDYRGPLKRIVWYIARKPEIKTVHAPHVQPGSTICTLDSVQKLDLFVRNNIEPLNFVSSAFDAGLQQAEDVDPTFGQGAAGYGKRFVAGLADRASSDFFHTFLFPVLFRQDPRYYRIGEGTSGHQRFLHALTHVFVARSDSGHDMFNFSEWLGTASAKALSNTYHPGNPRGFAPAATRVIVGVSTDMGVDILREFWPEVVRKFKLPFRPPEPAQSPRPSPTPLSGGRHSF